MARFTKGQPFGQWKKNIYIEREIKEEVGKAVQIKKTLLN